MAKPSMIPCVTAFLLAGGCQAPQPLVEGCQTDLDCREGRICEAHECVSAGETDDPTGEPDDDDGDDSSPTTAGPLPNPNGDETGGDDSSGGEPEEGPYPCGSAQLPNGLPAIALGPAFTVGEGPQPQGSGFIDPDPDPDGLECDVWAQDCPAGEKCMPWADDGGSAWNALKCSPVAPSPAAVGEPCEVEGSGVSGVDNCDLGAMCWDVDTETNIGACIELCSGSPADPTCQTPGTQCTTTNEVLNLCLPPCNPLYHECAVGQGCYPVEDTFVCAPDASGEAGAPGDPCDFINTCHDGLGCIQPEFVPGCTGAGCCSTFCELGDDDACLEGQTCVAWFEDDAEPAACLENLGVCAAG